MGLSSTTLQRMRCHCQMGYRCGIANCCLYTCCCCCCCCCALHTGFFSPEFMGSSINVPGVQAHSLGTQMCS